MGGREAAVQLGAARHCVTLLETACAQELRGSPLPCLLTVQTGLVHRCITGLPEPGHCGMSEHDNGTTARSTRNAAAAKSATRLPSARQLRGKYLPSRPRTGAQCCLDTWHRPGTLMRARLAIFAALVAHVLQNLVVLLRVRQLRHRHRLQQRHDARRVRRRGPVVGRCRVRPGAVSGVRRRLSLLRDGGTDGGG